MGTTVRAVRPDPPTVPCASTRAVKRPAAEGHLRGTGAAKRCLSRMASRLIDLAHECRNPEEFQRRGLAWLQTTVGFDAACFLPRPGSPPLSFSGMAASACARMQTSHAAYGAEVAPLKAVALRRHGVVVDTAEWSRAKVARMRYHRELAAPMGGRHSLLAYLPFRKDTIATLMLGRCGGSFSDSEVARLESLLPLLGTLYAAQSIPPAPAPTSRRALPRAPQGGIRKLFKMPCERVKLAHGEVSVRDRGRYREMVYDDGRQEFIWSRCERTDPTTSGWPYLDLMQLSALLAKGRARALLIGCGGAVIAHQLARLQPDMEIDLVEREPEVIGLARRWFGLGHLRSLHVHVADGTRFVADAPAAHWDVAIVDAYDGMRLQPSFVGHPFFAHLRRILRHGGALALNTVSTLERSAPAQIASRAAMKVFDEVRLVPVVDTDESFSAEALRNVVVLAR